MTDKLTISQLAVSPRTILSHEDGWQYEIICYEDRTTIIYSEEDDRGNLIEKEKYEFIEGFDLQVFDMAIKLRKEYIAFNCERTKE